MTIKDGEHLHTKSAPCGLYVNHEVANVGYSLLSRSDDILAVVRADSIGTHCSYGDLNVTFDGVDIEPAIIRDVNACDSYILSRSIPPLSDSLVKYSITVEFFGYNSEHVRKFISVDAWRVK